MHIERLTTLFSHALKIPKHVRYVVASIAGAVLLFIGLGLPYEFFWLYMILMVLVSYVLTWFSLLEDIRGVEWVLLFMMPVAFAVCWYSFAFLVPMRLVVRLGFTLTFPFLFYVLISAMNIFNVRVEKSLQLHRAAHAANMFVVTFIYYLALELTLSTGWPTYIYTIMVLIGTYFAGLQIFWSMDPKQNISAHVKHLSRYTCVVMAGFAFILSMLPFLVETARPIIMAGSFYVLTNLLTTYKDPLVWRQRLREYFIVIVILTLVTLAAVTW